MTRGERFALGSIAFGCLVLGLKGVAWWMTGSAALYSDALESTVNVAASAVAMVALRLAAAPADADHPYGHSKAEIFAAAIEGAMIVGAALFTLPVMPFEFRDLLARGLEVQRQLLQFGLAGDRG